MPITTTELKALLELMNEQGCGYLKMEGVELTVPNPVRPSLQKVLEQVPSADAPTWKVVGATIDKELFPEDHPTEGDEWQ